MLKHQQLLAQSLKTSPVAIMACNQLISQSSSGETTGSSAGHRFNLTFC